jgi:hypothetical protein
MSLSPLVRPETAIAPEAQIDLWSALPIPKRAVQFPNDGLFQCTICYFIAAIRGSLNGKAGLAVPTTAKVSGMHPNWGAISLDMPLS